MLLEFLDDGLDAQHEELVPQVKSEFQVLLAKHETWPLYNCDISTPGRIEQIVSLF